VNGEHEQAVLAELRRAITPAGPACGACGASESNWGQRATPAVADSSIWQHRSSLLLEYPSGAVYEVLVTMVQPPEEEAG
jgi:hypothetical protein